MAKRPVPPGPRPANLSPAQMTGALPKLKRRLEELQGLDPSKVQDRGDPIFKAIQLKIDETLIDIFGPNTIEYERYEVGSLDTASFYMGGTPLPEIRDGYRIGVERAVTKIQTIIDMFNEKLVDMGETPDGRALKDFETLAIHPEIYKAVSNLFKNEHYANAIEDSCKVLDGLVKIRSGKYDLSGTDLMQTVFSPKNPILKFNNNLTETERSEQQGMMFLYAGAMLAFRNPRAHGIFEDEPEAAIDLIMFVSFLAKSLDKAERI